MAEEIAETDPGLTQDPLVRAKHALRGALYLAVLERIHRALEPATYVEIGVDRGKSLRAARPDTFCVAIDPAPRIEGPIAARVRLFRMPSDEFFAAYHLPDVLGSDHFSLAFIDGLHLFEHALRDFVHLEQFAGPESVILVHDCLPLDEVTSARTRTTEFYSGDVWKLTLCLRQTRPDLEMVIVPTAPTGLCIISGFRRAGAAASCDYEACIAQYGGLAFDDYAARAWQMPRRIVNSEAAVTAYVRGLVPQPRQHAPRDR